MSDVQPADRAPSDPAPTDPAPTPAAAVPGPRVPDAATDRSAAAPDGATGAPASGWVLAGLALGHAAASAAVVLGGRGPADPAAPGVVTVASVDAALAVVLACGAALGGLRRAAPARLLSAVLVGSAVVAGLRAAVLGVPALAVTAVVAVLAVLVVRSLRSAVLVLAAALGAVLTGVAVAAGRGAPTWDAVLVAGVVAAVVVTVAGLRGTLARQAEEAAGARRAADALRVNDALTGVLNRRGLELMAEPMIELSRRRGEAVHALFVDVDGFALVNDELGYARGDEVLVAVAEALVGSCRTTDVVCRVGGDEFVVLGPGTGTSPLELERRMREILRAAPPVEESVWPARLSIGSATLVPWDDGDLSSLLGRADSDMRLRRSLRRQSVDRRDRTGDISPREV